MVVQTNTAPKEANAMNTKIRTTIIALVASASVGVASVAPAVSQAAMKETAAAAGCVYKGQETSNGGVVLQDDGIYYKCVNGTWVYDHKKARELVSPPPNIGPVVTPVRPSSPSVSRLGS